MDNQLEELKTQADALGLSYNANIGVGKLQAKIAAATDSAGTEPTKKAEKREGGLRLGVKMTDVQVRVAKAKSRTKVKITNLDPNNTGASTVTTNVLNMHMDLSRVIPLNVEVAVEECLIQEIEARRHITSTPEFVDGQATGNFKTIEAPVYAVVRY